MGIITAICSGKGGVGKSTTSVGIGYALAQKGKKVLILDLDAGLRTVDRITGIEPDLMYDSGDVASGNCAPVSAIYSVRNQQNLYVMPAPANIENRVNANTLTKLVNILTKYYDHVLMDCPAGLDIGFQSAVLCADKIVVVCTPDPVCVRSAAVVRDTLVKMGKPMCRLIINRFNYDFFSKIKVMDDLDDVVNETGIRLIGLVPEDSDLAATFFKGEKPATSSKAKLAFERIANRVDGVEGPIII